MEVSVTMILLATSIILLFILAGILKSKKALERELSSLEESYKLKSIELYEARENAKAESQRVAAELQEYRNQQLNQLNEEMRLKRQENDIEIEKRKASVDSILEDYKKSRFEALEQIVAAAENKAELAIEDAQIIMRQQLNEIEQLRRSQDAILEALRRKAVEEEKYNLRLSDGDRLEVADLQAIATRYPRVRQVVLKAIYDIYYAPEVKKLVSRIVGDSRVMGIYRISSRIDGRIYIGKSVDIRERWITHFKRAAGVESETTNLLYPAMRSQGLESFSFEIIEKVDDESKLSEREKYWQEFYKAKEHGFSVK